MTLEIFAILQNVNIFRNLTVDSVFEFSQKLKEPEIYDQFSRIIEEGDDLKQIILLVDGNLRIIVNNELVETMNRYDLYGLVEIITQTEKNKASLIVSSEKALIVKIPKKEFLNFIDNHQEMLRMIGFYIGQKNLRQMNRLTEEISKNRNIDYVLNKFERLGDEIYKRLATEAIERRFILEKKPDEKFLSGITKQLEISQGYLKIEDDKEERIRSFGDAFYRAIKEGTGIRTIEKEWPISQDEFEKEFVRIKGRPIIKTRYRIDDEQYKDIHFDVFKGELKRLVIAEIEFESEEEAKKFVPPSWFGEKFKEITKESAYKNKNLALYGDPRKKK